MKINTKINHKKLWLNSMIGMTWGFIASLIVGAIIGLFAINQDNDFSHMIKAVKSGLTYLTPFAIGVGVGVKLKMSPLQIFAIALAAFVIGHSMMIPKYSNGINWSGSIGIQKVFLPGDVFGAWIGAVVVAYVFKICQWEMFLDIIIVPLIGVICGIFLATFLTYMTSTVLVLLEWIIEHTINDKRYLAILLAPIMGALMGLALSLPTSSAAIAFALSLHGDAATAAMAATAAQMVSFGVMTYLSTNKWSQALAVGLGTSMLQMNNFIKKPKLLIIPTFMSALMAMIAVIALPLAFNHRAVTSGMGSAALYGQIFTLNDNGWTNVDAWLNVLIMQMAMPITLTYGIGYYVLKKRWIKPQEMNLNHT
ncbi:PTS sugar transporter subunit IIC [Candidatus Mycoplasma mahonii]|uniref:PTS sugar transporter subunit IIC n=1 Tax=Candidatus Mycoplasma mahonii TaxID=3004105 RepID=UPI0026F15FC5|nr:PTS sugar transporter subunit IIC [Candidatus Mycoplasma mahonii]WKX02330.1 PTS sugar transporter subunit IIC [Candidatus Mycoplasma mahonii]